MCLLHAIPDFLVIKPSSLGTQRVEKFGEVCLEGKALSFFYMIFLYGRARGLKNQGDFDVIGEESLFPKCEQLCLFSLIASLKASQTE